MIHSHRGGGAASSVSCLRWPSLRQRVWDLAASSCCRAHRELFSPDVRAEGRVSPQKAQAACLPGGARRVTPTWLVLRCAEAALRFAGRGAGGRDVGTADKGPMGCRAVGVSRLWGAQGSPTRVDRVGGGSGVRSAAGMDRGVPGGSRLGKVEPARSGRDARPALGRPAGSLKGAGGTRVWVWEQCANTAGGGEGLCGVQAGDGAQERTGGSR